MGSPTPGHLPGVHRKIDKSEDLESEKEGDVIIILIRGVEQLWKKTE
jgi:hypothetical protein